MWKINCHRNIFFYLIYFKSSNTPSISPPPPLQMEQNTSVQEQLLAHVLGSPNHEVFSLMSSLLVGDASHSTDSSRSPSPSDPRFVALLFFFRNGCFLFIWGKIYGKFQKLNFLKLINLFSFFICLLWINLLWIFFTLFKNKYLCLF